MDLIDTRPQATTLDVPVLVVGAGPAGLVTAIGLARQGVRPFVIERHASTSVFPRATGVSTRSMEIFRGWGIDAEVRRGGWRVIPRQATVRRLDDRAPQEAPLGFPDDAACLTVSPTTAAVSPQDHLEPVLVGLLRDLGSEVRFSTELVSFKTSPEGVDAVLRDRETGATTIVHAAYLVGADGHRSSVRTGLGIAMEGPDDLGRFVSILFRADLGEVLGERVYGLYMLEGAAGPPTVVVPSGADDRFVMGIPVPPEMDDAAIEATFSAARCVAMIRTATGRPDLPVEILATSAFAFSAQVASRLRDGRAFLVGDAAHRMTPRGGRGMNTAIADAYDLAWKLAWTVRGQAGPALLDSYQAERAPIGRRNVALSMAPGGGGTEDGLFEDLGVVVESSVIVPEAGLASEPLTSPDGVIPAGCPARRPRAAPLAAARPAGALDAGPVRARLRARHGRGRPGVACGDPGGRRSFWPRSGARRGASRRRPPRRSRRRVRRDVRPGARRRGPGPTRWRRRLANAPGTRRSRRGARRGDGHRHGAGDRRRPSGPHVTDDACAGGRRGGPRHAPRGVVRLTAAVIASLAPLGWMWGVVGAPLQGPDPRLNRELAHAVIN